MRRFLPIYLVLLLTGSRISQNLNVSFCDSVLFTTTGITENSLLNESVTLFPNPFNSSFQLRSELEMSSLQVFSCERMSAKEAEINCGELSPGIYFIKIETGKGTVMKRIIRT